MDLLYQIVGLLFLASGVWAGYWRWIRPHQNHLDGQAQGVLLLAILTLMGGFLGSFAWWFDSRIAFAWDLPPLASRLLASAGWTFAVLTFLVLEHPSVRRMRLLLIALFMYLVPLTAAILLLHLDRFDASEPITYGFFVIVVVMVAADVWYLLRQPEIMPDSARDQTPSSLPVKSWLALVAVVVGLWGLALFVTSDGGSDLIWLWAGDLLTSQLIGVMLLTIAAGALFSLLYMDTARLMLIVMMIYGAGVAVAAWWNTLSDKPIKYSYVVAFGVMLLISGVLLLWSGASAVVD